MNQPYPQLASLLPFSGRRALLDLLGTDAERKQHYVFPAGHIVPLVEVIRETLDWLDRYLGAPGSG